MRPDVYDDETWLSMHVFEQDEEIARLAAENARWRAAVQTWADAYPPDVFPPLTDDETRAAVALVYQSGISSERLHASWARHIAKCILEDVARLETEARAVLTAKEVQQ